MATTKNRDNSLCNDAVCDFWNREREYVKEGKGTRDWSLQQQIDIMNLRPSEWGGGGERKDAGVPRDESGKAYQGHHMKSAEANRDYQWRADNIQALTRDEHFAAHKGNFQHPTNGYYNPEIETTIDFGNAEPTKPEPAELSQKYIETVEYQYIKNAELESEDDCGIE